MKTAIGWLIGLVFGISVSAEPLLEGRVRLESGEPVADAQVRIFDLSDLRQGAIARALTDGTGYFALPLAALGGRALPARFALGPNYPNPFNPSTIIPYQLAASSAVRLEVFNLLGQRIATLVDGERPAGFHTATWHAVDGAGWAVGAGVYIYRMTVGVERQTGRMVLIDGQAGVSAGAAASVMPGASGIGGSDGADAQVYGLIVSGSGLVPYVDSSFRVEAGMAPVELVVSSGQYSAGKATDDDCSFCDLFGTFNDQQEDETEEEEAETDSTSSEGGPDLIVQSPSVSAVMLTPGQEFTLHVTVHNQGDGQAAATTLHYYRSNNATITSSDTEVGTDAVGALDASATSASSIALTAPTSVSAEEGIYYGACVASVSGESNTDNNCSPAVKITVSGQESPEEEETEEEEAEEATEEEEEDDTPVTIPDANLRAAIEDALGKASGAPITVAEMKTLNSLIAPGWEWPGISDLTGLESATNLTLLHLSHQNLKDVSALSGLTNLTELHLGFNRITDVSALRDLANLKRLYLRGNRSVDVSTLAGSGLTNLETLWLGINNLTDVSALGNLANLTELELDHNNLTDVSALSGLTKLKILRLNDNDLTDVSALGRLTNLETLGIAFNRISDISALGDLASLTELDLRANNITDVSALGRLTRLTDLNLGFNRITDLATLRGLARLTELDLRGNPLNVSSINQHIPSLKSNGATVHFDSFRKGDFDIELVFLDEFTEGQKNVLRYAVRRWMSIITEDLPDYEFTGGWSSACGDQSFDISSGERIDDLRIYAVSHESGTLGWGGPSVLRETHLPVVGCMSFNMQSTELLKTGLHEIGHVLGFGPIWADLGLLQDLSSDDPNADTHFNGPLAIAAFDDAGGRDYTGAKVPVEMDGAHWRYSVLEGEIMNPVGIEGVLSAITVQSLADLGYGVDVTQADPYTLPGAASAKASAKIAAAMPSTPSVDVPLADAYTLPDADPHGQGSIAGGLPLLLRDDPLRRRLESAEWLGGRGFDLRNDRLMGRLVPSPRAMPKLSCGAGIRREPIYVVDEQGYIIRTLGD